MKTKQLTEQKVFAYINEHHMLEPGDRVVAGISGGADSVCLLFVLLEYAKRIPMELTVVHVNHGIRREAGEDAAYVENLCREYHIPFYLVEEDVRLKAAEEKCSEEDAGRRVRYEAFSRVARERGASKIAVAHNSNDRSETMLFHLFRGSGIKGLSSIQPVRENIIRPILCLERKEIEQYLQAQGIAYCQDATNETDAYTRNRIRHHVIPYVEQEIVQGGVAHMAQTAEMLSEVEDYLAQQTRAAVERCAEGIDVIEANQKQFSEMPQTARTVQENAQITKENIGAAKTYCMAVEEFLKNHITIQKRILHMLVKELSPGHKDISYVHIQDLLGLFTGEGNRIICLPFGIRGRREYGKVYIEKVHFAKPCSGKPYSEKGYRQEESTEVKQILIDLPKKADLGKCKEWTKSYALDGSMTMVITILDKSALSEETGAINGNLSQKAKELPQNEYTKWFDYDKIKGYTAVRYRRTGDYLTISDGKGNMLHKVLKDYMISQKIPREQRHKLLLLAEDSHVIWLPGYRISEYYKISENTKRILQVQLIGEEITKGETEENNGRTC